MGKRGANKQLNNRSTDNANLFYGPHPSVISRFFLSLFARPHFSLSLFLINFPLALISSLFEPTPVSLSDSPLSLFFPSAPTSFFPQVFRSAFFAPPPFASYPFYLLLFISRFLLSVRRGSVSRPTTPRLRCFLTWLLLSLTHPFAPFSCLKEAFYACFPHSTKNPLLNPPL